MVLPSVAAVNPTDGDGIHNRPISFQRNGGRPISGGRKMKRMSWGSFYGIIGLMLVLIAITSRATALGVTDYGSIVTSCVAQQRGVEVFQEAIDLAGAGWTAGESWVLKLTREEQRGLLGGLLPVNQPERVAPWGPRRGAARDVPAQWDWRDVDGQDWITPVKNQGGCGSCAAFASAACVEAAIRIAKNMPAMNIDLSEQQIFSCAGGDCPTGLYMGTAFDYIKANGLADEACLPYDEVDDNCGDLCADWQDRVETIDDWELLWQYTVNEDALKTVVMEQPVACYLEVYGDFMSYSSGVYEHVSGGLMGGHFVLIVGWNDEENSWICKNSWGSGWGEKGYFRIKRGETQIGSWAMIPYYTPAGPTPTPTPVPDLGVTLSMPQEQYASGDTFYLDATITNPGAILVNTPLFIILDVADHYWFWPSWGELPEIDFQKRNIPAGTLLIHVIPEIQWPDMDAAGVSASFWAAMLEPDFSDILGTMDRVEWGF
jgi:C1A family cysteine protease